MTQKSFRDAVSRKFTSLDLAEIALLFAKEENQDLDINLYMKKLAEIKESAGMVVNQVNDPEQAVYLLNDFFFNVAGFKGNTDDYFNPLNSYLNEVIDTKKGIPITLSIIYLDIGLNLGLPLAGINFPGHFLVKCVTVHKNMIIDCFNNGRLLSQQDCEQMLETNYGDSIKFTTKLLQVSHPLEIVVRLISNLKHTYIQAKQYEKAIKMAGLIEIADHSHYDNILDKANIYLSQMKVNEAAKEFEKYLKLAPHDTNFNSVKQKLKAVKSTLIKLN